MTDRLVLKDFTDPGTVIAVLRKVVVAANDYRNHALCIRERCTYRENLDEALRAACEES